MNQSGTLWLHLTAPNSLDLDKSARSLTNTEVFSNGHGKRRELVKLKYEI